MASPHRAVVVAEVGRDRFPDHLQEEEEVLSETTFTTVVKAVN